MLNSKLNKFLGEGLSDTEAIQNTFCTLATHFKLDHGDVPPGFDIAFDKLLWQYLVAIHNENTIKLSNTTYMEKITYNMLKELSLEKGFDSFDVGGDIQQELIKLLKDYVEMNLVDFYTFNNMEEEEFDFWEAFWDKQN